VLKEDYPFTVNTEIWDTIVLGNITTGVAATPTTTPSTEEDSATPTPTEGAK